MKKPSIVANVREVLDLYDKEEISFSRMVEMLNEIAEKFYEPKWISVDEMLPEKLRRVLVIVVPKIGYKRQEISFHLGDGYFDTTKQDTKVTHWMPLIESPKTK